MAAVNWLIAFILYEYKHSTLKFECKLVYMAKKNLTLNYCFWETEDAVLGIITK